MIENSIKQILENKFTDDELNKEKLIKVLFLAQKHLNKFQLHSVEVKYINSKRALGKCYNNGELIGLDVNFCLQKAMDKIESTILHEIAHAIVGIEFGHRIEWQTKALELGLTLDQIKRYQI